LRIAIVSALYPYRGGISQLNNRLYKAFAEQDHQVKAFNFSLQYPSVLFPGTSQLATQGAADTPPSVRTLNSLNPVSWWKTAKLIQEWEPDFVFMRYWMPFFAPSLGTVAYLMKRKGIPTVAIIDNATPHEKQPGGKWLTRTFLRQLKSAVVMSNQVKDDVKNLLPELPLHYHPHPFYDHFGALKNKSKSRQAFGFKESDKVLLFFGLIRPYKGLDVAIKALAELPEEYKLLVVGEPYEGKSTYLQLINQLDIEKRVSCHFHYVPDNEVNKWFSMADCCVLPYKSATQSGIVATSFHFEVPVVVTDVGGLRQTVESTGGGLVAPEATPTALADTIRQFFTKQPTHYQQQIVKYSQQYNWHTLARVIAHASE
jgi:glycosyltransferase involved in cell wall biosynthesis